jgi:hypothetical protein
MPYPQAQTAGLVTAGNLRAVSTTPQTAANGDVLLFTTAGSAMVANLPLVAQGGPVTVRKVDAAGAGVVTVKSTDSSTIDGIAGATGRAVNITLTVGGATFVSDGVSAWFTVAS